MHQKYFTILVFFLALSIMLPGSGTVFADNDYVTYKCTAGNCQPPRYPIPDMAKPQKGVTYIDTTFHSDITRVTDKNSDGIASIWRGSTDLNPGILVPEYSRSDPENADGNKLIITQGEGALFLYDATTLNFIKGLTTLCGGPIPENFPKNLEPRWDAHDPNIFYYVYQMGFYKFNIQSDTITLVHDFSIEFPEGLSLTTNMEGEPSQDTRYWAFSIRRGRPDWAHLVVFTYDLQENRIIGQMDHSENSNWPDCNPYHRYCDLNTITVSPKGDRVVIEWGWQQATGKSTWAYDMDFTSPIALGNDGHSDIALTADGRQVHVIKDDSNDVFAMLDINTGERTNLVNLPLSGNQGEWGKGDYHISGNSYEKPGWVVISTYGKTSEYWHSYQVFLLELKTNPRIWRIAHTHGGYPDTGRDYWAEAQATINRKGTKIYWRSNWGVPGGDVDTYQTVLPTTWWNDFGGRPGGELQKKKKIAFIFPILLSNEEN